MILASLKLTDFILYLLFAWKVPVNFSLNIGWCSPLQSFACGGFDWSFIWSSICHQWHLAFSLPFCQATSLGRLLFRSIQCRNTVVSSASDFRVPSDIRHFSLWCSWLLRCTISALLADDLLQALGKSGIELLLADWAWAWNWQSLCWGKMVLLLCQTCVWL